MNTELDDWTTLKRARSSRPPLMTVLCLQMRYCSILRTDKVLSLWLSSCYFKEIISKQKAEKEARRR